MGSIKNVVAEPIEGHEDYYMVVSVPAAARTSEVFVFMKSPSAE